MKDRFLLSMVFVVVSVMIASAASAAMIGAQPHQFYGEVTVSGNPAPDGLLVVARIGGLDVAATTTFGGSYGRVPPDTNIFYIPDDSDPNNPSRSGQTVEFFVYGIKAGEHVFLNGNSTHLDLAITADICGDGYCTAGESCSSCSNDCGKCGGGGSSSSGGGYVAPTETPNETVEAISTCVEDWTCSDWLDCVKNQQKRICVDYNRCGTTEEKPAETRACVSEMLCNHEWTCTEWSECQDGTQTRTCTDKSPCGTEEGKPAESQACGLDTGMVGFFIQNPAGLGAVAFVIIVVVAGFIYFRSRHS